MTNLSIFEQNELPPLWDESLYLKLDNLQKELADERRKRIMADEARSRTLKKLLQAQFDYLLEKGYYDKK